MSRNTYNWDRRWHDRNYPTIKKPEPPPQVITKVPASISGRATTLGDLIDRALERFDRMRESDD